MSNDNVTNFRQRLRITQPAPLSIECIEKPLAASNSVIVCWDDVVHYAGLYLIDAGMWHVFGPFDDYGEFQRYLGACFPEAAKELH